MSNIFNMLRVVDFNKKFEKYWVYFMSALIMYLLFSMFYIILSAENLVGSLSIGFLLLGFTVTIVIYFMFVFYSVSSENKTLIRDILLQSNTKDTIFDIYRLRHKVFEDLSYTNFILLGNTIYKLSNNLTTISEVHCSNFRVIDGRLFYLNFEFTIDRSVVIPNNAIDQLYVTKDKSKIGSNLESYIDLNYMSHNIKIFESIGMTEDMPDFSELFYIITDDNSLCIKDIHVISENFYRISYCHTGDKLFTLNDKKLIHLSNVKQMNYFNKENELVVYFEDNDKSPLEINATYEETKLLAGILSLKGSVFSS